MMIDVVSRLYDAAAGEDDWSDVLDGFREEVRADTLFLGVGDPRTPNTLEYWSVGWHAMAMVDAGYQVEDSWDPSINPAISAGMIMPIERSLDHRQIIPEETSLASDFIRQTVYKNGFSGNRLYVPMRDASVLSGGFISKRGHREFDAGEVARLDHLLPHLGRAMRLRHQLARQKQVELGLSGLLDTLDKAVFLIDRDLIVLFQNGLAEDMARRGEGLSVKRGRLSLGQGTPALLQALADIESDALQAGSAPVIPVPTALDAQTLVARVHPGIGFAGLSRASRVAAAIILEVPREAAMPEPAALQRAYGLTPAEAAVARLVPRAGTRRAIAETMGLSDNTVKTHLASIRAKTGARNQVELAQMLQRNAPIGTVRRDLA